MGWFVSVGDKKDYCKEMNSAHWKKTILASLPAKCIIDIDNAKYHSRQTD